ncbi:MFS transporter [Actinosynnema mirum]|uniref:Major facilitator superfamily MFS_1 n=1 Tax=Actinosynnema mirum (strain ATCC 29888 / DSM 43827 / JCM 3225 / NBRC 14064 / NCIMB 13271 / NRRL B-12336 / IMRU 3971 / 101) TaxID=446462 RepID=C6W9U2_ACTMD|nr:MFS transporter [Actinosynnema mirum]ACU37309.1 major facilitator superfamily MFS_1 [Actinosynnema mirum DSM 43827]
MSVADSSAPPADRRREQRAWIWYDWANSVFPTSVITVFFSLYLGSIAQVAAQGDTARNGAAPCLDGGQENSLVNCDISLFGLEFPAGSLWGYLLSVATVIQVLVLPVMGAIADRTQNKRAMMGALAFTGSAATMALATVTGTNWQLGVGLFIIANICYGASVVVYYAFLPEIAAPEERDAVSSRGWAFGYLGGGLALALHLALYLGHDAIGLTQSESVRLAFVLSGIWWAAFTLVPLRGLRAHQAPHGGERGFGVVTAGFKELGQTLRFAKGFPLTLAFLGTYLIYTDGIATVANVSAQYGSAELKLEQSVLITTILIVQFVAFFGGLLHGWGAKRWGTKRTIMISLGVWIVVVGAAYFVQAGQQGQFFALAAGIGIVLGGTNALSRSLFSQMIPPGREAQYFSLYEVGERSTSWLGPLVFAGVGQATGSFRLAIVSLVVFFVVGLVLMVFVPVRRAIKASGNPVPETV